jgi:O-antigen/teichoic acid export membrane protein
MILSTLALLAAKIFLKIALVARALPESRCWRPRLEREHITQLLRGGGWQVLQTISATIFMSLDRWLIVSNFGAAALARYNIPLQLAQICHTLPAAAFQVLIPWSSRQAASTQWNQLRKRGMAIATSCAVICTIPSLVTLLFAERILSLWISEPFAVSNIGLSRWLIVAFGVLSTSIPSYYILFGTGHMKFVCLLNLSAGALYSILLVAAPPASLDQFSQAKLVYGLVLVVAWFKLHRVISLKPNNAST